MRDLGGSFGSNRSSSARPRFGAVGVKAAMVLSMKLRIGESSDEAFLVEMARLACGLKDRPLPEAGDPEVLALLPASPKAAVVAINDAGEREGAAWWHVHDPPLMRDDEGQPIPELGMAVAHAARGQGVGAALVEAVASRVAEQSDVLALNVHLLSPAIRLYVRTGFVVAGRGRGRYGVAMQRALSQ